MTTITVKTPTGSTMTIRANFRQASSTIELLTGLGEWTSTPYQVAPPLPTTLGE